MRGAGQATSAISVSERHHHWAQERFRLEHRRDLAAQSVTWMLLISWFSIVFATLWGMARTERPHHTRTVHMPPVYIHVVMAHDDWHPPFGERCMLEP